MSLLGSRDRSITVAYEKPVYVEVLEKYVEVPTGKFKKLYSSPTEMWPIRDLGPNGYRGNRSYDDFLWLRDKLKETLMFIPGLPPKKGLFSRIVREPEVVSEEVRFKLERFLNRIYERDFLRTHPATKAFMSASEIQKSEEFKKVEKEISDLDAKQKIEDLRKAFPGIDDAAVPDDVGNVQDAVVRLQEIFKGYKLSLYNILVCMQKFINSLQSRAQQDDALANMMADNLQTERSNEADLPYTASKVGVVKRLLEYGSYYNRTAESVEQHVLHPMGYEYEDSQAWIQLCEICKNLRGKAKRAANQVAELKMKKQNAEEKSADPAPATYSVKARMSFSKLKNKAMGDLHGPWDDSKQALLDAAISRSNDVNTLAVLMEKVVLIFERPKHWNGKNRSFNRAWKTFVGKHVENCTMLHQTIIDSRKPGGTEDDEEDYKQHQPEEDTQA